jgi:hypothetical protein
MCSTEKKWFRMLVDSEPAKAIVLVEGDSVKRREMVFRRFVTRVECTWLVW